MKGINRVTLLGNLSGDAEYRVLTNNGAQKAVATVSLATNETFKDAQGNTQEKTEWHKLVFWDKLADVVHNYTRKGSKVYVEGKLRTRSYQDKQGQDKYITEIQVTELVLLDNKSDNQGQPQQGYQRQSQPQPQPQQGYPQGYQQGYQGQPQGYTGVYTQQQSYPQGQTQQGYQQGNNGGYMTPPHDADYRQQ